MDTDTIGNWHHVTLPVDPAFVGQAMSGFGAGEREEPYTGQGTWDIWLANAVIVHADGSVLPLFTGQSTVANIAGVLRRQQSDVPDRADAH